MEPKRLTPPAVATPGIDRRGFLARLGAGAACAWAAGLVVAGARYIFPNVLYEAPARVPLGPPDRFPPGEATYLPDERIFVFRDDDGLSALSSVCTHLGCNVRRVSTGYECPCHGSRYDTTGKVTHGPAPRSLAWRRLLLSPRGLVVADLTSEVPRDFRLRV